MRPQTVEDGRKASSKFGGIKNLEHAGPCSVSVSSSKFFNDRTKSFEFEVELELIADPENTHDVGGDELHHYIIYIYIYMYIYIYIYTHTHTHTHIYIYIYIYI